LRSAPRILDEERLVSEGVTNRQGELAYEPVAPGDYKLEVAGEVLSIPALDLDEGIRAIRIWLLPSTRRAVQVWSPWRLDMATLVVGRFQTGVRLSRGATYLPRTGTHQKPHTPIGISWP
jgi:hypothetical protein